MEIKNSFKIWTHIFLTSIALNILLYGFCFESFLSKVVLSVSAVILFLRFFIGKKLERVIVNKYFRSRTIIVSISTISSLIFIMGFIVIVQNFLKEYNSKNFIVKGYVRTALGDPLEGAFVSLSLLDKQIDKVPTEKNGSFTFRIDNNIISSDKFVIKSDWHYLYSVPIEIALKKDEIIEIRMPAGVPPIKISYYLLQKQAIDFFINGKISSNWEQKLSNHPYIVKTNTFENLLSLTQKFSIRRDDIRYLDISSFDKSGRKKYSATFVDNDQNIFFVGNIFDTIDKTLEEREFNYLIESKYNWNIMFNSDNPWADGKPEFSDLPKFQKEVTSSQTKFTKIVKPESFTFWGYSTLNDINFFYRMKNNFYYRSHPYYSNKLELLDYYKYLTQEYSPTDFSIIEIYYETSVCGESFDFVAQLYLPTLKVFIAVVENISVSPIQIDNFSVLESKNTFLRNNDAESEKSNFNSLEYDWFPIKTLKPGERIVIPMKLIYSYDSYFKNIDDSQNQRDTKLVAELREKIVDIDSIAFPIKRYDFVRHKTIRDNDFIINKSTFLRILDNGPATPNEKREFYWGASYDVERIKIDGVSYPFRKFNKKNLIIEDGTVSGCCPFLYTYSGKDQKMKAEGTILYGRIGKANEAIEEKKISQFNGKILIVEKENEISYIDYVCIKIIDKNKNVKILYPNNRKLRFDDNKYLVMRKGDSILIDFMQNEFDDDCLYFIVSKGYYTLVP